MPAPLDGVLFLLCEVCRTIWHSVLVLVLVLALALALHPVELVYEGKLPHRPSKYIPYQYWTRLVQLSKSHRPAVARIG